ncbi:hypothetical protein HDU67_008056 [Dinochytrium kinnereticum]|nr:hypothetical protein HDU67_008056 [Dinochytrium kinnereticum]
MTHPLILPLLLPLLAATVTAQAGDAIASISLVQLGARLPDCTLPCLDWFVRDDVKGKPIERVETVVQYCGVPPSMGVMFEMCTFMRCGHEDLLVSKEVRLAMVPRCERLTNAVKDLPSLMVTPLGNTRPSSSQSAQELDTQIKALPGCRKDCIANVFGGISEPISASEADIVCGSMMKARRDFLACSLTTCPESTIGQTPSTASNTSAINWIAESCGQTYIPSPPPVPAAAAVAGLSMGANDGRPPVEASSWTPQSSPSTDVAWIRPRSSTVVINSGVRRSGKLVARGWVVFVVVFFGVVVL